MIHYKLKVKTLNNNKLIKKMIIIYNNRMKKWKKIYKFQMNKWTLKMLIKMLIFNKKTQQVNYSHK